MKQNDTLSALSSNRQCIMGAASLMVLFCHNTVLFHSDVLSWINRLICNFATIGVDIFLLCSGIGCCYSLSSNHSVAGFYKKRALRVLLPYGCIIGIWIIIAVLIKEGTLGELLHKYSLHSFFSTGNTLEWYVPALLALYIVSPFLYYVLQKHSKSYVSMIVAVVVITIVLSLRPYKTIRVINAFFISRIPIFMLGMYIGKNYLLGTYLSPVANHSRTFKLMEFLILLVIFLLNYMFNPVNYEVVSHLIFIPISFLICCNLNIILPTCCEKICSYLGQYTLEIYLIHDKVFSLVLKRFAFENSQSVFFSIIIYFCSVFISIIIAILAGKALSFARRKIA